MGLARCSVWGAPGPGWPWDGSEEPLPVWGGDPSLSGARGWCVQAWASLGCLGGKVCAVFSRLPSLPSIQLAGFFAGPWHHIVELLPLGTWGSEDFVQSRGGTLGL